jgi:hypothetical protein
LSHSSNSSSPHLAKIAALRIVYFIIDEISCRILVPTRRLELFRKLNPYMRYIILFKIFWTKLDWDDHLHAFFMDGKPWPKNVFWDKRDGGKPTTEGAVIGNLGLHKGQNFLYVFDFGDEWRFNVKVEDARYDEAPPYKPVILEEYKDSPEQY